MEKTIGWGILGCGKIARKFASDLKLVNSAARIAVASRDVQRAEKLAQEFGFPSAYGSYEELVNDDRIDVIYIATPHSHHHAQTLLCLNAGKAVLCEKAFAVNSAQAKEMIDTARQKKVFLMEALWSSFLPHILRLRELLEEKKIGDINSVLVNFGFRPDPPVAPRLFEPSLAGGTLLDIGIYNVFITMEVLGRPDIIDAVMVGTPDNIDKQLAVTFRYNNGQIAQLFSSFVADLPTIAHISGSKGRLELTHRFYAPEATIGYYPGKIDSLQNILVEKPASGFGYQYEAQHVTDCLLKGLTESPQVTHEETLVRMEVLDEIRRKAGIRYPADSVS